MHHPDQCLIRDTCPQPEIEMKEMVAACSMAISQSTEYPQIYLASFSRILFTTGWRFLLVSDCFGSGSEGWQIRMGFGLPSI